MERPYEVLRQEAGCKSKAVRPEAHVRCVLPASRRQCFRTTKNSRSLDARDDQEVRGFDRQGLEGAAQGGVTLERVDARHEASQEVEGGGSGKIIIEESFDRIR